MRRTFPRRADLNQEEKDLTVRSKVRIYSRSRLASDLAQRLPPVQRCGIINCLLNKNQTNSCPQVLHSLPNSKPHHHFCKHSFTIIIALLWHMNRLKRLLLKRLYCMLRGSGEPTYSERSHIPQMDLQPFHHLR